MWFDFQNAYTFTLMHISKNSNANAKVLSHLPRPATAVGLDYEYLLIGPSDLDVWIEGASRIHSSRVQKSSSSDFYGLTIASGNKRSGGIGGRPRRRFFVGRGGVGRMHAKAGGYEEIPGKYNLYSFIIRYSYSRRYTRCCRGIVGARIGASSNYCLSEQPQEMFLPLQVVLQRHELYYCPANSKQRHGIHRPVRSKMSFH